MTPETRADLDQLWHTIQTYVNHSCDGADGCPHCHAADVDAVRATVAYQRIQAKLKATEQPAATAPFKLGDCVRCKGETLTGTVSEVMPRERSCRVCFHDDGAFGLCRWDEIELVPTTEARATSAIDPLPSPHPIVNVGIVCCSHPASAHKDGFCSQCECGGYLFIGGAQ